MQPIKATELKSYGEPLSWRDRLVREGRLRAGTQDWDSLRISAIGRRVDIQSSLRAVREDSRGRTSTRPQRSSPVR